MVAENAREQLALDCVLFVPAGRPWLKDERPVSTAHHRVAMVERGIAGNASFQLSNLEVKREGPSYTVDTLLALYEELGSQAQLYVILGVDSLREVARWHEPERLFELATLVGIARPGCEDFDMCELERVSPGASRALVLIDGPLVGISGTSIRRRVAEGRSIRYMVPKAVEEYIYDHGLYTHADEQDG